MADALGEPVTELQRLSAGAHRETWSLVTGAGQRYILQRLPAPTRSTPGIEFEASVLRAAADAGVPVARVVAVFENGGALETAALLLEYVPGEALPQRIMRDERFAAARAGLARECGALLARLHAIGADAVPGLVRERPDARAAATFSIGSGPRTRHSSSSCVGSS